MSNNCDYLLTNALVLTMDEEFTQYTPGAIAVQGDSILAVGPADEIAKEYTAKETLDCGGKMRTTTIGKIIASYRGKYHIPQTQS